MTAFRFDNITCPECHAVHKVEAGMRFLYFGCSCGTALKKNDNKAGVSVFKEYKKAKSRYHQKPVIDIGVTVLIRGEYYYVAGYCVMQEEGTSHCWAEYIMYNSRGETSTISEFKNCYNLNQRVPLSAGEVKDGQSRQVIYKDEAFQLYNKYRIEPLEISGEIPADIFATTAAAEYISPPRIIIVQKEKNKEAEYYLGEYIGRKELKTAFGRPFPKPEITSPTKPLLSAFKTGTCAAIFVVFVLVMYIAQEITTWVIPPKLHLNEHYHVKRNDFFKIEPAESVTPSFEINEPGSNLYLVYTASPLFNDWFDGAATLVNETTNEERTVYFSAYYYSGYDDGGSWSEGDPSAEVFMSRVPPGRYHLVSSFELDPTAREKLISLKATEDEQIDSNFWGLVIIGGIVTLALLVVAAWIETTRWSNSDYSPFEE